MTKLVAPDKGVKATDVGGRSYSPNRGGIYEVNNKSHASAMKREGFTEASLMGPTKENLGFTCSECGFGSWFRKCSRCGHETTDIQKDGD
jgi:DNA-directed RNA polymerase subunit RPC12/RpoP